MISSLFTRTERHANGIAKTMRLLFEPLAGCKVWFECTGVIVPSGTKHAETQTYAAVKVTKTIVLGCRKGQFVRREIVYWNPFR